MSEKMSAEDIVDQLPTNLCAANSMKAQFLSVAEILRICTDAEHGLTADVIGRAIGLRTGKTPSEAKVLDDIHTLSENKPFGMEIEKPGRGESIGFRCTKMLISSAQARFLINMVQTCKFITSAQRTKLCNSLHEMVSVYQQDAIVKDVYTDRRETPTSLDVFNAADVASEAIKRAKMIRFKICERGFDGIERFVPNKNTGSDTYEDTPLKLVYSFGNYYLETWGANQGGKAQLLARRLDRIRNPEVSDKDAEMSPEISELRNTVEERTEQTFDMWGSGLTRTLFLEVKRNTVRYVYDRLGTDSKFEYIDSDETRGLVCVRVKVSPTFYRWLFGMGDGIRIMRPQGVLWENQFWKSRPDARKPHSELVEDYEEAIRGLKGQMEKVASVYAW